MSQPEDCLPTYTFKLALRTGGLQEDPGWHLQDFRVVEAPNLRVAKAEWAHITGEDRRKEWNPDTQTVWGWEIVEVDDTTIKALQLHDPRLPRVPEYPEHEKLKAVQAESQAIGEFMDWAMNARTPPILLREAVYDEYDRPLGKLITISDLLAEYFEIDQNKLETEKRKMLEELRKQQERPDG